MRTTVVSSLKKGTVEVDYNSVEIRVLRSGNESGSTKLEDENTVQS